LRDDIEQNFIYAHLNRIIKQYDLNMIYISGPEHGGPAVVGKSISKAPTAKSVPTFRMKQASRSCSNSSRRVV